MADQKISDMTAASSVANADLLPIVQGGANKKATKEQVLGAAVVSYADAADAAARRDLLGASSGVWPIAQGGSGGLTNGRVPYTAAGVLADSAAFTFSVTTGVTLPGTDGTFGITVGNGTNGVLITRDTGYRTFVGGAVNHQIPYNSHVVFNAVMAATNFTVHTDLTNSFFYIDGANNRASFGGTTNSGYTVQVNGTLRMATGSTSINMGASALGATLTLNYNDTIPKVTFWAYTGAGSGVYFASDCQVMWNAGSATGASDTGIARHAAAVLRLTNGSTGKCDLLLGPSTSTKDAAATFQIDSTTQGMLPPRHTAAQRVAVSTPPEGLIIHDTSYFRPYVRSASTWRPVGYSDDRTQGAAAYVNGVNSYAFGDFMSFTNYEAGIGILTQSGETASAIVREDGLFHCPDDGLVADQDQGTQIATLIGFTNSNTPQVLGRNAFLYDGLPIPADYAGAFDGIVIGVDTTNYECCSYQIKGMVKNVAGTLSLLGSSVTVLHEEDPSWDVTLGVDSVDDMLQITVTGDADNQTRWTASLRFAYNSMLSYIT